MPEFTKALFLQALDEWGRYAAAFERLAAEEQNAFLKQQGFASLRDLLAHVAGWWEEGEGIIRERLERGEGPARKYDLDAFNAASLARFSRTPEDEFFAWYESQRQQLIKLVSALTPEQMKIHRVYGWLDADILEHLKEHGVDAPRFLTLDMLRREWADCVARFNALTAEEQAAYLNKQGYARFRDLAAHVIAGWQEGIQVIQTGSDEAVFEAEDEDAFNANAVERYGKLQEAEVFAEYEKVRATLIRLVETLPDEVYSKRNVQDWLRADVLAHYYEHAM
jgi:hypothetical protein